LQSENGYSLLKNYFIKFKAK